MGKCKWCGNNYRDGIFSSGFCSTKCEIEGGDRGVKKTSPIYGIITISLFIAFIYFSRSKKSNSQEDEINNVITTEESYNSPENNQSNINNQSSFTSEISKNEIDSSNENRTTIKETTEPYLEEQNSSSKKEIKNDVSDNAIKNEKVDSRILNNQKHQLQVNKAIEMLKQNKSTAEIIKETSLMRPEIAELRLKIEK